jgi:inorganic pyrophosphatase
MNPGEDYWQWRPHPWHGLSVGRDPPRLVNAYIEITPLDAMKYEIDKNTGYLRMDRPQTSSSLPPTLYGFIPQTYCASRVARLSRGTAEGDGDALDICVITERPITRAEVLVSAKVIGILKTLDGGRADDKILAVLEKDPFWGDVEDVSHVPPIVTFRLRHYFGTYKMVPAQPNRVEILGLYGTREALAVVSAAMDDYDEAYRRHPQNVGQAGGLRPARGSL